MVVVGCCLIDGLFMMKEQITLQPKQRMVDANQTCQFLLQQIMKSIIEIIDAAFEPGRIQIRLKKNLIDDASFEYLLTKKEIQTVTKLDLTANRLSPLSMLMMSQRKWASLTHIWLDYNKIGDKGCKYLSRVSIPQVINICLYYNQISSLGVSHLSKAKWKHLRIIHLDQNRIGVDGVKEITKANWKRQMEYIYLCGNQLCLEQVYKLVLCDMPKIRLVWVSNKKVQEWSKDKLRQHLEQRFVLGDYFIMP